MASTREKLIDWLADLPDDTEIGIEDEDLLAIIDTKAHFFTIGALPAEAIEINLEAFSGVRRAIMARLLEIHEEGAGIGTTEGAMVVTYEGYMCGVPDLFTTDTTAAFRFKDRAQAESLIAEFRDVLLNPQVLDHP